MMIGSWQHTDRMRLGTYVCMGAFLAAAVSLVVRERAVCLVAIHDGRCDNDNATFESITFSYIGILCGIYDMGAFSQPWCHSWFERAQFAWSRFATGAVTMTTRHSTISALIYIGGRVTIIGEAEVAACRCRLREHS